MAELSEVLSCSGCRQRQRQIDELQQTVFSLYPSGSTSHVVERQHQHLSQQSQEHGSTLISERTQSIIDNLLLDNRQQMEKHRQAIDQMTADMISITNENNRLLQRLREKENEVEMLSQQNIVFLGDFKLERQDRERAHGKLAEKEQELDNAKRKIVDLEEKIHQLMLMTESIDFDQADQHHHINFLRQPGVRQDQPTMGHSHTNAGRQLRTRPPWYGYDTCDCC